MATFEKQYNAISRQYAELAKIDPVKRFVQYPEALRLLGDVHGKRILDVGCGTGLFSSLLASQGAQVEGYDSSDEQIRLANKQNGSSNIAYRVATPATTAFENEFDAAVAVMVLLYAKDNQELRDFFRSTYKALRNESRFVAVTYNPSFQRLDTPGYRRIFSALDDNQVQVTFLGADDTPITSARFINHTKGDYEIAAREAGFAESSWVPLRIDPNAIAETGEAFWNGFGDDPPYIGFVAAKT